MLKSRIVHDAGEMESLLAEGRRLSISARSELTFHQLDFPRLWWKHFNGSDGSEFGEKRGRNFLGARSFLEADLYLAAEEDGALLGLAPLVVTRVERKGKAPALRVLSFCADSVQVFYQDFLVRPDRREEIIASLFAVLADYIAERGLLLFLGYIPDNSPNLPGMEKEIAERLGRGWAGGVAASRTRAGVYPWNIAPLCKVLSELGEKMGPDDPGRPALASLVERLEKQTSALMLFQATRLAFEKEVQALSETFGAREDTREIAAKLLPSIASIIIRYPYLSLPKTKEEYLESLSSSKRYYFRRYLKKYQEAGGAFENLAPASIGEGDVDEYLRLHAERWGKDSVSVNPTTLEFHKELSLEMARRGVFRLFFARWQGRRIAAHACFDIGRRREYFFSGRSPDAEELRAGKLMVMHTILDAIENGFEVYDFGYGGDEYKADFTKTHKTVRNLFLAKQPELFDPDGLFTKYEYMQFSGDPGK